LLGKLRYSKISSGMIGRLRGCDLTGKALR
jgi:hypothetical protein